MLGNWQKCPLYSVYTVHAAAYSTQSGRPMHTTFGLYCIVLLVGIRITYMDFFQLKGSSNDSYYLLGKGVNLFVSSVWFGQRKENQPNYQRLTLFVCSPSYLHVFYGKQDLSCWFKICANSSSFSYFFIDTILFFVLKRVKLNTWELGI
jgi:hypothetical protein